MSVPVGPTGKVYAYTGGHQPTFALFFVSFQLCILCGELVPINFERATARVTKLSIAMGHRHVRGSWSYRAPGACIVLLSLPAPPLTDLPPFLVCPIPSSPWVWLGRHRARQRHRTIKRRVVAQAHLAANPGAQILTELGHAPHTPKDPKAIPAKGRHSRESMRHDGLATTTPVAFSSKASSSSNRAPHIGYAAKAKDVSKGASSRLSRALLSPRVWSCVKMESSSARIPVGLGRTQSVRIPADYAPSQPRKGGHITRQPDAHSLPEAVASTNCATLYRGPLPCGRGSGPPI